MKMITRLAALAALAFGANAAWAVPLQINVTTAGVYSAGTWTLSGTQSDSESWTHAIFGNDTWNLDLDSGSYNWGISGDGFLSGVSWSLTLAGQQIFSGSDAGWWSFDFDDNRKFTVTSVPEPATLALLGMGLLGVGFAARRRRAS